MTLSARFSIPTVVRLNEPGVAMINATIDGSTIIRNLYFSQVVSFEVRSPGYYRELRGDIEGFRSVSSKFGSFNLKTFLSSIESSPTIVVLSIT